MPSETNDTSNEPSQTSLNTLASNNALKQKRARSQLSCVPCRAGKLKCNRSHEPACDQCIKRNRESSCLYVPAPTKQKPTQNVKGRIKQLESLVVDLMNQQNTKAAPSNGTSESPENHGHNRTTTANGSTSSGGPISAPTSPSDSDTSPLNNRATTSSREGQDDIDCATKTIGKMNISKTEISYVGETHWQAILNGISDLKKELGDEAEVEGADAIDYDEPEGPSLDVYGNAFGVVPLDDLTGAGMGGFPGTSGLGFMLGASPAITREQLIASVPEKKVADRLLSLWFNSPDPFKPIIHAPTFQDEYRRFWRNPKETPTMWLGLLFAILSLAASFGLRDVDPTSDNARRIMTDVNKYHTLSACAAVLADFTKPKQHTIEGLLLYSAGLRSDNAFVNVWLVLGLVVRLALRMGYHRDASNYPGISTFDGEIRRRVWATISMIDVLISFQLGLPSMVKTIQSDTQPPRNLLDRDFSSTTIVLPPSRNIDELTPSSYTRAKLHIVRIFADVSDLIHATIPATHEELMSLDRRLDEGKEMIPPLLQMPDISELVTDPAEQLMCRFNLDLLYLKTKIVLHRKYMDQSFAHLNAREQQMGVGRSRKACISAALRVLQHHQTIYQASQAGGQLESVKWYMGSISTHDFLLAAMVICLELSQQMRNDYPQRSVGLMLCPQRAAMMDALEKSQKIWYISGGGQGRPPQFVGGDQNVKGEHMLDETEKAGRAMTVMLEKVNARFPQQARALAKANETEQTAPSAPMGYMQDELGIWPVPVGAKYLPPQDPAFGGVVSFHQWGNVDGVPDNLDMTSPPFPSSPSRPLNGVSRAHGGADSSNDVSTSSMSMTTNSTSQSPPPPGGQTDAFLPDASAASRSPGNNNDFSLLGDMLDVQGNIDWGMFDTGMNTTGPPFTQSLEQHQWSQSNPYSYSEDQQHDQQQRFPIAGNVLIPGGSGAVTNADGTFPSSWMMEGINFDFSNMDGLDDGGIPPPPVDRSPRSWRTGGI